ncbi:MAG: hypothetical protein ACOVSW_05310 [Candidatus Kapaibacteriota bacterium]
MSSAREIEEFVLNAIGTNTKKSLVYSTISPKEVAIIKAYTGIELEGFKYILQADNVRHILNRHGNPIKEEQHGSIAITINDFR